MGDDEPTKKSQISASLGDLDLEVEGVDEAWVVEQFEKQWAKRLEEAAEMKDALRQADKYTQ